jgi:hypothetical protein
VHRVDQSLRGSSVMWSHRPTRVPITTSRRVQTAHRAASESAATDGAELHAGFVFDRHRCRISACGRRPSIDTPQPAHGRHPGTRRFGFWQTIVRSLVWPQSIHLRRGQAPKLCDTDGRIVFAPDGEARTCTTIREGRNQRDRFAEESDGRRSGPTAVNTLAGRLPLPCFATTRVDSCRRSSM